MKFKKVLLSLIIVGFTACGIQQPEPVNIESSISETQLVDVLVDVHLVETAYRMSEIKRDSSLEYSAKGMYQIIYEKHGINRDELLESLEYYTYYPEKLKGIYKQVEEKIESLK